MLREIERYFKKIIKGKCKYTKTLLITFLMTGALSFSVPITPNANGEYIVNSSTGDGEITNNFGHSNMLFRISDGKKLTVTGDGDILGNNWIPPYVVSPNVTLSGSNTQFIAIGTGNGLNLTSTKEHILYTVTDPVTGSISSANNQVVTLTNVQFSGLGGIAPRNSILVEARNGQKITGAILNLIGPNASFEDDDISEIGDLEDYMIKVEADDINGAYSELTVNADGGTGMYGLVKKESKSILNMNIGNNAGWVMRGDLTPSANNTAVLNNLNIKQGGTLNAGLYSTELDGVTAKYFLKLTSDGINNDGLLTNEGEISLFNTTMTVGTKDIFTIEGNYHGNNGKIKMDSVWNAPGDENGSNFESDLVHITGNASGTTQVVPVIVDTDNNNIIENKIPGDVKQLATRINSLAVIKVDGSSDENTFIGTAQTTGAAEAQLTSRQVNGVWEYYWTIAPIGSKGSAIGGIVGGIGSDSTTGKKPIYIMAQPVSAYTLMPKVNLEMGYENITTLHERRGENQVLNWENMPTDKGQIWTRVFGKGLNEKGDKRFEYESDIYGVQAGYDFKINKDEKGNTHLLGGYIAYNRAKADFFDRYRTENGYISDDKYTGKGKAESISLGLTKTKYTENGSYYDLVGQMSFLQNKYDSRDDYDAKQNGYGMLLSAEVGKSFRFSKNSIENGSISIEPQAQVSYQYLHTKSFDDGLREVKQDNRHGLRGRAGVRVSYDKIAQNTERTNTYYAVANVLHDFVKNDNKGTAIGSDKIKEKFKTTWGEIGLGAQAPIGQKSNMYIDTRYEHSFGNENRSGYRGTVGFKTTF